MRLTTTTIPIGFPGLEKPSKPESEHAKPARFAASESLENNAQDVAIAQRFSSEPISGQETFLASARQEAGDGRHEWDKSTQSYDSPCHRKKPGFPSIGHVKPDQTISEP